MARSKTAEHETLHAEVRDRLRAADQLYTTGRRLLVELLAEADHPVTIPELMSSHAEVALSSAYRNFVVLEQVGVVTRILSGEHARFELTEEVRGDHHHHLICSSCGRVEDFTVPSSVERSLEKALAKAIEGSTFVPVAHRLDLIGTCGDCVDAVDGARAVSG
ncbi:MAG: Fur family transcriptional regulator [Acidimicrobiia bacterium]